MKRITEIIIKSMTEAVMQMIQEGIPSRQIFNQVSSKFDRATARLIFADVALDGGMVDEVREYFKNLGILTS